MFHAKQEKLKTRERREETLRSLLLPSFALRETFFVS